MFKKENFIASRNCKPLQNQTKHFVGGGRYLHEQLHQHLPRGSKTVQVSGGKDKLLSCSETPWEIADEGESTCSETSCHLPARGTFFLEGVFCFVGVRAQETQKGERTTRVWQRRGHQCVRWEPIEMVGGAWTCDTGEKWREAQQKKHEI